MSTREPEILIWALISIFTARTGCEKSTSSISRAPWSIREERPNGPEKFTTGVRSHLKVFSAIGAVITARLQTTLLEICARCRMDTDHYGRAFPEALPRRL